MVDLKRCERADVHKYHGWTEPSPHGLWQATVGEKILNGHRIQPPRGRKRG